MMRHCHGVSRNGMPPYRMASAHPHELISCGTEVTLRLVSAQRLHANATALRRLIGFAPSFCIANSR